MEARISRATSLLDNSACLPTSLPPHWRTGVSSAQRTGYLAQDGSHGTPWQLLEEEEESAGVQDPFALRPAANSSRSFCQLRLRHRQSLHCTGTAGSLFACSSLPQQFFCATSPPSILSFVVVELEAHGPEHRACVARSKEKTERRTIASISLLFFFVCTRRLQDEGIENQILITAPPDIKLYQ